MEREAALNAARKTQAHALFPSFCEQIGVQPEQFAQDENEAETEVQLFEEWLAEEEAQRAALEIRACS